MLLSWAEMIRDKHVEGEVEHRSQSKSFCEEVVRIKLDVAGWGDH
jgi:hypothetical protein